jgi:N,N'-diacetyllegionaminate synthase
LSVFFIAEAGVNHNGDVSRAHDLIDLAKSAGADAIKFQTFSAELLASKSASKADYQKEQTGEGSQFEMLRALELSAEDHRDLFAHCQSIGLEFMSTPFDEQACDFLVGLGMQRIKVPSGEITNHRLLRHIAAHDLPIVLSTGMATLDEILQAITVINSVPRPSAGRSSDIAPLTVLHCTSNYPTAPADVNLRAMQTIAEATELPVGYSDHTLGISVSLAAVALGAKVIEKHFTLDRNLPGPDHQASLGPEDLVSQIREIRVVEAALGSSIKGPATSELSVRAVARRSVALTRDCAVGHVLEDSDLTLLRPGTGIEPQYIDGLVGRILTLDKAQGDIISWPDLVD